MVCGNDVGGSDGGRGGFLQNCSVGKVDGVYQTPILTTDGFGTLLLAADTGVMNGFIVRGNLGLWISGERALALSAQT